MSFIGFPILSLIYLLIFLLLHFSKKRINLFENKIVIDMMIVNLIGLLLELGCYVVMVWLKVEDTSFGMFILKSYIAYISVFNWFLTGYIFVLTKKSNGEELKKSKYFNKIMLSFSPLFIIVIGSAYISPLYYNNVYPKYYTYGLATEFLLYSFEILSLIWIVKCIMKIKGNKNNKNKHIGIIIFGIILCGIAGSITQFIDHSALIITSVHTLTLTLIYFTIENPDMKMLDEVHKAKEITDSANEEKAIFLYNITNEIKGISRDIEHDADAILLETNEKDINIENINDKARDIKAGTARFNTMTNEILDISSVDSSRIKIYNNKYSIKLIIRELVQMYKAKSEEKGLEFRTNIASDLPEYLYGDSVGVKTSLNTILDNSVKYTERGYIEFSIDSIIKNDIARLIISIEDSGTGMKVEELNKIFNKKEENDEGTNLKNNLFNTKNLVTLMGGTIIPSSIYGKGTIIKIVLDQKIAEEKTEYNKYENVLDKKRILLVDDNISSVKMITKLLKDSNIILESVSTGKACLDKIRDKEKYNLILLDEKMKPLDGIMVMRKLQEVRSFNTNVILLTRNNDYEYNNEHISYGFKDYLLKPIDKDKLLEIISKYSK